MAPNASSARPTVLYMSYDGLLEPLGESQVVAYLEILADDYIIHIISFEKPGDIAQRESMARMETRLRAAGIVWHPRRYHRRPKILSTLWDMTRAMLLALVLALRHRALLLHARSVLCAAMLFPAKLVGGAKLLVDIRGFWVDERVDGGMIAARGAVYRVLKHLEKTMLVGADHIVTLTRASVPLLRDDARFGRTLAPITVIPTCADLALFSPALSAPGARDLTIGYVGQIGTWYMLDAMLAFFAAVHRLRPDARLVIVNQHQQDQIARACERHDIAPRAVEIVASDHRSVPAHIRRMDAGLALISPFFSKIASAPTKLAEYLGCGVPVVGNAGCGDMARIIADDGVGVAMPDTRPETIEAAAAALLECLADPTLGARCVASAHRHFALDAGAERYRSIYRSLTDGAT
ncbi:glycosyltransferase [Sphingomonas sp. PAMC 26605]|uniref:glycosyltransferase n=1 Tax=Sphingomonas sp. PAMC 26605 TaxID=1112214 RepID=UPI00026CA723|nr:glycosyltransferase [Sphingomonas sp. PAMC 26605]